MPRRWTGCVAFRGRPCALVVLMQTDDFVAYQHLRPPLPTSPAGTRARPASALPFVNDLPGALVQIRRALKPDGLMLAALAGGETLTELRQAFAAAEAEIEGGVSPRVIPFADLREMGALLQRAGFALPVVDTDRLPARYASPISLIDDLRR